MTIAEAAIVAVTPAMRRKEGFGGGAEFDTVITLGATQLDARAKSRSPALR
jgi:hypothetical protein